MDKKFLSFILLFDVSRQAFLDDVKERVPHAYKAVRIKKLARASDAFEKKGNFLGMARMLEQIAREVGGAFTNRREFTGKDGGAIKVQAVEEMTTDQLKDELRSYGFDPDRPPAPITKQ